MYRQGDVLLIRIEEVPREAKAGTRENGRIVLAHGEATGHAHAIADIETELLERDGDRFVRVGAKGARLTHEEHGAIALPPGSYRVVIQREYSPEKIRHVED